MYCMRKPAEADKRTQSLTLRVERSVLAKLREEADRKSKSINTIGNQILKFCVNWHSVAVDTGFIYMDKKNLSRVMDRLTLSEIDKILDEYFENEFLGRVKMLTGNNGFDQFIRAMEGWVSGSGLHYRHTTTNDGIQTFVIQHDMGKNAAYYITTYFRRSLEIMGVNKRYVMGRVCQMTRISYSMLIRNTSMLASRYYHY